MTSLLKQLKSDMDQQVATEGNVLLISTAWQASAWRAAHLYTDSATTNMCTRDGSVAIRPGEDMTYEPQSAKKLSSGGLLAVCSGADEPLVGRTGSGYRVSRSLCRCLNGPGKLCKGFCSPSRVESVSRDQEHTGGPRIHMRPVCVARLKWTMTSHGLPSHKLLRNGRSIPTVGFGTFRCVCSRSPMHIRNARAACCDCTT